MPFPVVSKKNLANALALRKGRLSAARLAKRIEAQMKGKVAR
jgi:hypothetical protein